MLILLLPIVLINFYIGLCFYNQYYAELPSNKVFSGRYCLWLCINCWEIQWMDRQELSAIVLSSSQQILLVWLQFTQFNIFESLLYSTLPSLILDSFTLPEQDFFGASPSPSTHDQTTSMSLSSFNRTPFCTIPHSFIAFFPYTYLDIFL